MNYSELYSQSIENKELFWKNQAQEIYWKTFPNTILSEVSPLIYHWFADGFTNMSYLCLDAHIEAGRGQEIALIYESPVTQQTQIYSYQEVLVEVNKLAHALKRFGLTQGDTCVLYMPMIPQAVFSMLACARLGVTHSVVFGGFAPRELAIRIDDAKPKLLITADYGMEFDKIIDYTALFRAAKALANHQVDKTLIYFRDPSQKELITDEYDYEATCQDTSFCDVVWVKSTHPLYILYTSGTTGKPKGIVRDTGGYATALKFSMEYIYGVKQGQTFWAASDVGWVVGHSYIVYGPMIHGCPTILFEGKPIRTPDAGIFWRIIEKHKVSTMFTAPTAIRAIRKEDEQGTLLKEYDISSLNYLFLAGERCDPATFLWAKEVLQKPVIDHWWQTESGWPMLGLLTKNDLNPNAKVGSSNLPIPGYSIQILDESSQELPEDEEGFVALKLPAPPGFVTTLWNNQEGFIQSYLSHFRGYYLSGDGGYRDQDGYFFIMGRIDDVINVSGHRLSTGEMEEIIASHQYIAECAVVGVNDKLRGQKPIGFIVLKDHIKKNQDEIATELTQLIRDKIGAIAFYKQSIFVKRLPKTRSGKILRKNLRMLYDQIDFETPSTIDDPKIISEIALAIENSGRID
ncbi:MAG: AMP-binding protein [Chitinophagales bacterium]|jgi:propionyl-CoA synthetase|nr:AMP-binding protein [Chitinophagales bacterium]